MPYVKRGMYGEIVAVFKECGEPGLEEISHESPELKDFLQSEEINGKIMTDLQVLDQAMPRIAEDLIDVLTRKGIITLADFPMAVQEKLLHRRALRGELSKITGIVFDEDDQI